jgi:hypothetical protein
MSSHRYNTRFQAKKNAAVCVPPPTYQAPAVPPPIKLPEECPNDEIKTTPKVIQEISRLLNMTKSTEINEIDRLETMVEIFTIVLANQSILMKKPKFKSVLLERAISLDLQVERKLRMPVLEYTNDDAQRTILYRILKMMFKHTRAVCKSYM